MATGIVGWMLLTAFQRVAEDSDTLQREVAEWKYELGDAVRKESY